MSKKIQLKPYNRQATPVSVRKSIKAPVTTTPPKADRRLLDQILVEFKPAWDALAKR